jgi:septal ring factor EnvC (AmiA/AmiB activator)
VSRVVRRDKRADASAPHRGLTAAGLLALLFAVSSLACPLRLPAQTAEQRLRQQREELDKIRLERSELQRRLQELQGKAHDLAEEATNMRRQADATTRLVRSLDRQLEEINQDVDSTSESVGRAEENVRDKRAALRRRLVDIYKRGPTHTVEALLSARTFGELVGRYRYLHELALHDRAVVGQVERLYDEIDEQRSLLLRLQEELRRNREEKATEIARLRSLEGQRTRSLAEVQQTEKQVKDRLARIQRDEQRLGQLLASLEAARRREESGSPTPAPSTLRTSDLGQLDWPVEGTILYRFGRAVNPNNTTIRWNGIGIQAATGTPVKAVAAGEVMLVQPIGTYGLTVIIQHGGGDYSVYGSLSRADVRANTQVRQGQVIGAVGAADPEMEAHLHFEIRPKGRATDPLEWLAGRR